MHHVITCNLTVVSYLCLIRDYNQRAVPSEQGLHAKMCPKNH